MVDAADGRGSLPLSVILPDDGDELLLCGVLPSLAATYQGEVDPGVYEIILVTQPGREAVLRPLLDQLGVAAELAFSPQPERDFRAAGAKLARGDYLALFGSPGVASPLLLAALLAAFAAYPSSAVVVPHFELDASRAPTRKEWLTGRGWPETANTLTVQATFGLSGEPRYRWLDPKESNNVCLPRAVAIEALMRDANFDPASVAAANHLMRVQLVGDAMVGPTHAGTPPREPPPAVGGSVDAGLEFFGRLGFAPQESVARPPSFRRQARGRPKISSVLVTYNMRRETPRTLQSLLPGYQQGIEGADYELILVDNGSQAGLSTEEVKSVAPDARYFKLEDPPPSPAYALNYGAAQATGDIIAILSDGASLLSPRVFAKSLRAFAAFPRPVIITHYFFLGPGRQTDTILAGYDRREEDRLLASINWPEDGYRLFEISFPQSFESDSGAWLGGWFESDCIIMGRDTFDAIGGCDERFDLPGGGLMIMDLLFRSWELADAQPVKLIGEGVFHQFHGGITTNTTPEKLRAEVVSYKAQYEALRRAPVPAGVPKSFYFLGDLPATAARRQMKD
jgi:glycosyltransferase involved in cell wall biosynthesis